MEDLPQPDRAPHKTIPHYHGDIVRVVFFIAGLIMIVGLPLFKEEINFPIYFSIFATMVLVILAGLTNPKQMWIAYLNLVVSLVGFVIFEYEAATKFDDLTSSFFIINQILALLFFTALYFSVKTLRGFYLRNR